MTIGSNILQFYRQYQQDGAAAAGEEDGQGKAVEDDVESSVRSGHGSSKGSGDVLIPASTSESSGGLLSRLRSPWSTVAPSPLGLDSSNSGGSGSGESDGGMFLYEQGHHQSMSSPGDSAQAVAGRLGSPPGASAGGASSRDTGTGSPASSAEWETVPLPGANCGSSPAPRPAIDTPGLSRPSSSSRRAATGPLDLPQRSSFRRGGRKKGLPAAAPGTRMQALSTIYEVAFKNRGRDAAAAFREIRATPAPGATAAASAAAAAAAANGGAVPSGKDGEGAAFVSDEDSGGDSTTAPSLSTSMVALQQNALVQEMLGVKVRRSGASGSSGSSGSGSESSSVVEDEVCGGAGGGAEGDRGGASSVRGNASSFFPWRPRSRPYSTSMAAKSEISSLTDAHDYQLGSLGPSLGPSPARALRPGFHIEPSAALEGEHEGSGCSSSGYPSSEVSMDSWEEAGREAIMRETRAVGVGAAAGGGGGGGGGGGSVAGQSYVSGSSGASTPSSLLSDGGRSIVTESDWRDWMTKKEVVK